MSDVKDVVFQSAFFDGLGASRLHFFKQDVQYGGDDFWDTKWYRESYGSAELNQVIGKSVLCIGTVLGSCRAVEDFLEILCGEILKTPFIGVEQSVFNHLFYTDAFKSIPFEVYENTEGPILTLTAGSWKRFNVCPDGVFTIEGKLLPIIHMYDRHRATFNYFSNLLGHEMKEDGLVGFELKGESLVKSKH
jgi:hypothetical protein